jgi:hypothetical protein
MAPFDGKKDHSMAGTAVLYYFYEEFVIHGFMRCFPYYG